MRQIDNMTPQEIDTLALKGMTAPRTASERAELYHTFDVENNTNTIESTPESEPPAPDKAQHSRGWLPGMSRDQMKAEIETAISERNQCREDFSHAARRLAHADKLAEALRELFKQCAMVHKYWGEGCNVEEADFAVAEGKAALAAYEGAQ